MNYEIIAREFVNETYWSGKAFFEEEQMAQAFRQIRKQYRYICIFGGGVWGTTFCSWCLEKGIRVDFFCDNDRTKLSGNIKGVPFISFEELCRMKDETFVIVSVADKDTLHRYNEQINLQIGDFPHKMKNLLRFNGFYTNDYILSCEECAAGAGKIVSALGDKRSKELFVKLLKYRFVNTAEPVEKNDLQEYYDPIQYFNSRYYRNSDNAVIIDCGAYFGDSLMDYINLFHDRFHKYYCFEIDDGALGVLKKTISALPCEIVDKVVVCPVGVYRDEQTLAYHASTDTAATAICCDGEKEIQLVALDDFLDGEAVTMIKMDIENSELNALMGATKIIEREHPILAISIYHSTEEFFRVPLYILEQFPFYKLYLDLHTTITDDVVLYAIPDTINITDTQKDR